MNSFYWNTVTETLKESLIILMSNEIFQDFRLVGGTALSLHLGHRMSVDIDLFTHNNYGSVNFEAIDDFLKSKFSFVSTRSKSLIGFGRTFVIGTSETNKVKLDLYYTDTFVNEAEIIDGIRLASISEIAAMKIDVVQRRGRKKDFWDIHELLDRFTVSQLLDLHLQKYPYNHEKELILKNMIDFEKADDEPDPTCLKGKYWDLIKLDIIEAVKEI